jgi:uncharacterized protein (DUF849 family)
MVAPNGARRGKADHPALPVTIQDTVDAAKASHVNGANALHLHVRDANGAHSIDAGLYLEALKEMSLQVPDMRVQITTEAVGIYDVTAQLECLKQVRPDWASISVREIARAPELAERLYATCAEQGTEVQHILYNTDDVELLGEWQSRGIIDVDSHTKQDSVLFVLGRYTDGQLSDPADLDPFLAAMPDVQNWMVCAFGPHEHACLAAAARHGGDVRVGFENSLTNAQYSIHKDNASSVAALRDLLQGQTS